MFRAIRNITLLLVVCFIASGVPLYADSINLNLSSIGVTSQNNLMMDVQLQEADDDQQNVIVQLSTEGDPITISFEPNNPLTIDLYHDDLHIKKLDPNLISFRLPNQSSEPISVEQEKPFTIEFSIKQEELDIPNGDYRLSIKPNFTNLEEAIPTFNVALSFNSDYHYKPALASIKNNETALNLYFPSPQFNHLIPITRVIPYTNTPLRYTLNNLEKGPDPSLGLPLSSPIPLYAKLGLKNGIAGVYLPQDIGKYETNSTDAYMAMGSFIKSLTSIDAVKGVQFYFGNKIKEIGFHDSQVDKPFYPKEEALIYGGTITETNRMLLTPIPLQEENPTVESLFSKLRYNGNQNLYNYSVQPPLPETVELVSHSLQESILTLNLSEGFLMAYRDNNEKNAYMLEALVYSMTSLPEVKGIILQVEGETLTSFAGQSIPNPIYPSKYINPEK